MQKITGRAHRRNNYDRFRPPIQQFNKNVNLVVVSPNGQPGQFAAHDDRARLLVVSSRQPLLDACRVLLAEGRDPNSWVVMRHQDSDVDSLRTKIGIGARLTVAEGERDAPRFRVWKPLSPREGSPPMRANEKSDALPQPAPEAA